MSFEPNASDPFDFDAEPYLGARARAALAGTGAWREWLLAGGAALSASAGSLPSPAHALRNAPHRAAAGYSKLRPAGEPYSSVEARAYPDPSKVPPPSQERTQPQVRGPPQRRLLGSWDPQ